MTAPTKTQPSLEQRRRAFVASLYRLGKDLDPPTSPARVARARRTLAQLRRLVTSPRYEPEAFAVVFDHNPPKTEEHVWMTVAGLFALNPRLPNGTEARQSLSAALGTLNRRQESDSGQKRLRQLLASTPDALPVHLRTTLQLLAGHSIPVDFDILMGDLVVLLNPAGDAGSAAKIRWQWARAFHRRPAQRDASTATETPDDN